MDDVFDDLEQFLCDDNGPPAAKPPILPTPVKLLSIDDDDDDVLPPKRRKPSRATAKSAKPAKPTPLARKIATRSSPRNINASASKSPQHAKPTNDDHPPDVVISSDDELDTDRAGRLLPIHGSDDVLEVIDDRESATVRPLHRPGIGQKTAFDRFMRLERSLNRQLAEQVRTPVRPADRPAPPATFGRRGRRVRGPASAAPVRRTDVIRVGDASSSDTDAGDDAAVRPTMNGRTAAEVPLFSEQPRTHDAQALLEAYADDNFEVKVKVRLLPDLRIRTVCMRRYETFARLGAMLDEELGSAEKTGTLVLTMDDEVIDVHGTPHSVGYRIGKVIGVRRWATGIAAAMTAKRPVAAAVSAGQLVLNICCADRKRRFAIRIERGDQMIRAFVQCAQHLQCDPTCVRMRFEGDPVNPKSTSDDLELDGGEQFDVTVVK